MQYESHLGDLRVMVGAWITVGLPRRLPPSSPSPPNHRIDVSSSRIASFLNPFFVANDNRLHPIDVFSSPKKPSFANPPSPAPRSFFRHFGLLLFFSSPEHETLPIWNKPDPICTLALREQNAKEPNENLRHRFTTLNFTGGNRLSFGTWKIESFGQNVVIS